MISTIFIKFCALVCVCVCVFVLCRYRGVVEAVPSRTEIQVFYSDFGNVSILHTRYMVHYMCQLLSFFYKKILCEFFNYCFFWILWLQWPTKFSPLNSLCNVWADYVKDK